jgi:hypothetical protein
MGDLLSTSGPMVRNNPEFGGAITSAAPSSQEQAQFRQASQTPMVPLSAGTQPGTVLHGMASAGEQLTTPQNAALLLATAATGGTLGAAALEAQGYSAVGVKLLNEALTAYFVAQTGHGLTQNGIEAFQAWKVGDYDKVAEKIGAGSVDGLFTYFGLKHAIAQGRNILRTPVPRPQQAPTGPYNREPVQPLQNGLGSGAPADPAEPQPPAPENSPSANPPESTTSAAPDQAQSPEPELSAAEQKAVEREAKRQARTSAALEHARQNPGVSAKDLQRQFQIGGSAAANVLAQAEAERVPRETNEPASGESGESGVSPSPEITPDTVMASDGQPAKLDVAPTETTENPTEPLETKDVKNIVPPESAHDSTTPEAGYNPSVDTRTAVEADSASPVSGQTPETRHTRISGTRYAIRTARHRRSDRPRRTPAPRECGARSEVGQSGRRQAHPGRRRPL